MTGRRERERKAAAAAKSAFHTSHLELFGGWGGSQRHSKYTCSTTGNTVYLQYVHLMLVGEKGGILVGSDDDDAGCQPSLQCVELERGETTPYARSPTFVVTPATFCYCFPPPRLFKPLSLLSHLPVVWSLCWGKSCELSLASVMFSEVGRITTRKREKDATTAQLSFSILPLPSFPIVLSLRNFPSSHCEA